MCWVLIITIDHHWRLENISRMLIPRSAFDCFYTCWMEPDKSTWGLDYWKHLRHNETCGRLQLYLVFLGFLGAVQTTTNVNVESYGSEAKPVV